MKTLVVYFSHIGETYFDNGIRLVQKGNAEIIAEKAQRILGSDIFHIETIKSYPVNYKACCDEALIEQKNGEFPELKNYPSSIDEYEKFVFVYPCWWGTVPQAFFTFLSHYDFSDKEIYPICTHEGSGMGRSESDIERVCASAIVKSGLAVRGSKANECDDLLKDYLGK